MKRLVVFLLICASFLCAEEEHPLVINNAVLARVNGKVITVLDLVKKMDVVLMRYHPEQFAVVPTKVLFYKSHWKSALVELIDRELVLKAASDANLPISAGDVRQELEEMFGPQIMVNIERAGLTYSEAYEMVKNDITIRRMMFWQVSLRAQADVGPEEIKKSYDEYLADKTGRATFTYRMCTLRGDQEQAMQLGKEVYDLIATQKISLADVGGKLPAMQQGSAITFSLSDSITQRVDEMAETIIQTLQEMNEGQVSAPQVQTSRSSSQPFVRLYILEKKAEAAPQPFDEVSSALKEGLMDEKYATLSDAYFVKLRRDFHVDIEAVFHALPKDFQPFGA